MSLLVVFKILGYFLNTLTADGKYSLRNSEILQQTTQMQLPKKQMTHSQFFGQFLKSTSVLEHFQEKDEAHSFYISKITECGERA